MKQQETLSAFPIAEDLADEDELAKMIGIVVGEQENLAQNRLPGAVRNSRE